MKIKATCDNCEREIFVEQILDSGGHCPWCGAAFQSDYAVVLTDALEAAENAGQTLENALEKAAELHPRLTVDEDSVLGEIRRSLAQLR